MTTYPLCLSCARIVTGLTPLDTTHRNDRLARTQIAAFLDAAGPLAITDTKDVPDATEWACAACGEIGIGPARWVTATSTALADLYPEVLVWLHANRPDCGHSGRRPQVNLPDGTSIRFCEDEDRTNTWTASRVCPDGDTLLTTNLEQYFNADYQEPIIAHGPTGDLSPHAAAHLIQELINYGPYLPTWPRNVT